MQLSCNMFIAKKQWDDDDGLIGHFVHGRLIMEGECVIFFGIISYSRVEFVRLAWRFNWRAGEVSLD